MKEWQAMERSARMDDHLAQVLRVYGEPYQYVTEQQVHAALTSAPERYLGFLEDNLRDIARGLCSVEMPPKQIFSESAGQGDFRVMPCVYRRNGQPLKTVKIVGTNTLQQRVRDQITVGKAFCLHPKEHYVTHIFEACLLSSARTGACATIAMKRLHPDPRRVTIVGSGRVGYYAAIYVASGRNVREMVFHDVNPSRAELLAQAVGRQLHGAVTCHARVGPIERSDVVILATTSCKPIFRARDISADLVISVGADIEDQRELMSDWPAIADVYVEFLDSFRVGDLKAWLDEGAIKPEQVTDLMTLLRQDAPPAPRRPRVFISTGSALFDNMTIAYLLEEERMSPDQG